ncbi:hypothetical protein GQ42DRAFT_160113, partial [Ramicandelaber brevisporus]
MTAKSTTIAIVLSPQAGRAFFYTTETITGTVALSLPKATAAIALVVEFLGGIDTRVPFLTGSSSGSNGTSDGTRHYASESLSLFKASQVVWPNDSSGKNGLTSDVLESGEHSFQFAFALPSSLSASSPSSGSFNSNALPSTLRTKRAVVDYVLRATLVYPLSKGMSSDNPVAVVSVPLIEQLYSTSPLLYPLTRPMLNHTIIDESESDLIHLEQQAFPLGDGQVEFWIHLRQQQPSVDVLIEARLQQHLRVVARSHRYTKTVDVAVGKLDLKSAEKSSRVEAYDDRGIMIRGVLSLPAWTLPTVTTTRTSSLVDISHSLEISISRKPRHRNMTLSKSSAVSGRELTIPLVLRDCEMNIGNEDGKDDKQRSRWPIKSLLRFGNNKNDSTTTSLAAVQLPYLSADASGQKVTKIELSTASFQQDRWPFIAPATTSTATTAAGLNEFTPSAPYDSIFFDDSAVSNCANGADDCEFVIEEPANICPRPLPSAPPESFEEVRDYDIKRRN